MATAVHDEQTFAKGSPVLAYWLAHSEGFRVRGRRGTAIVDCVLMQPHEGVTALALRSRVLRRRRLLAADAVEAVVPGERVLLVGRRSRGRRARAAAAAGVRVAHLYAAAYGQFLREWLANAWDGDAARRWIGIQVGNAIVAAGALRSAILRCSSFAAAAASAARSSAAASARAARSSRGSSSS